MACEPLRLAVRRAPGRAGRKFDIVLPAGATVLGARQGASYLHVDYLPSFAPEPGDAGMVDRYRAMLARAVSGSRGVKREPLEFAPVNALDLGNGEYLFLGAPVRESAAVINAPVVLPPAASADPEAHEQPLDPSKQGASEEGA